MSVWLAGWLASRLGWSLTDSLTDSLTGEVSDRPTDRVVECPVSDGRPADGGLEDVGAAAEALEGHVPAVRPAAHRHARRLVPPSMDRSHLFMVDGVMVDDSIDDSIHDLMDELFW